MEDYEKGQEFLILSPGYFSGGDTTVTVCVLVILGELFTSFFLEGRISIFSQIYLQNMCDGAYLYIILQYNWEKKIN